MNAPFRTPRHSGESATLQPADLEMMPAGDPAAAGRGEPTATLHKDELSGPSNAPAPDSAAKTAATATPADTAAAAIVTITWGSTGDGNSS